MPVIEVIQPHVPVRLPCGDFALLIRVWFATLAGTSPNSDLTGVTGSVCRGQGSIHRESLFRGYYGFRIHEAELQASILTEAGIRGLASPFGVASHCSCQCDTRVAQGIRAILTCRRPHLPPPFRGSPLILLAPM